MTKVLGILCSPRKGGNTEILLKEALASAVERGAETELLIIYDKEIKPCDGCYACQKTGNRPGHISLGQGPSLPS